MEILLKHNIITGLAPEPYKDVIRRCGRMLLESGYIKEPYIGGMLARDKNFSTAIGNLIAIPHGEMDVKKEIIRTGLVVLTYPDGVEWNGETVKLVVGIAAEGDGHLKILERIVEAFEDESDVEAMVRKNDAEELYNILSPESAAR